MLITHLKPHQLLGKNVYDNDGQLLGVVVGITGRRGRVKVVVLSNGQKYLAAVILLRWLIPEAREAFKAARSGKDHLDDE